MSNNGNWKKLFRMMSRTESWLVIFVVTAISFVIYQWNPGLYDEWNFPADKITAGIDNNGRETPKRTIREVDIPKTGKSIKFLFYNVCNYFVEGEEPRSPYEKKPKAEQSRKSVIDIMGNSQADIIGLCELGGAKALQDIQQKLRVHGMDLPYSYVLLRSGEDRALGFLSRYPVVENESVENVDLGWKGRTMLRGILDVTVELPDHRLFRFVGVHLKSKKDDDGTAEHTRRLEAHALRKHLQEIQSTIPMVVYGDFNDSPNSPTLQITMGNRRSDEGLTRVAPADSRKERWTLLYSHESAYLSYDHLLLNKALRARLGRSPESGIIDPVDFLKASDHRAIWIKLK